MPVGDEEEAEGLITERRLSDGRDAQFAALMSSIRCGRVGDRNGRTAGGLREARFFASGVSMSTDVQSRSFDGSVIAEASRQTGK